MKIRTGFVSNSSSSSFVIAYREATLNEIHDPNIRLLGKYLCEGNDYFQLDKAMISLIEAKGIPQESELLYVYLEEEDTISLEKLKAIDATGEVKIRSIETDYHSTNNYGDFMETYYGDNDEN